MSKSDSAQMLTFQQRIIRSFAWLGGAQAIGQAATWLSTLFVIRLLTPEDYGLMAMAMLFLGFLFLVADLGVGAAAIQSRELDQSQIRTMSGVIILTSGLGFLLTFLSAPLLALFYQEPRVSGVVRALSVNFVLMAFYLLPQARLARDLDFASKSKVDLVTMIASAATTLGMAFLGFGIWALVGGMIVQNASRALLFQVVRPTSLIPDFRNLLRNPLVQFGVVMSLDRVLFFMYSSADIAIGGRILGPELIGLYTVAATLSALPMDKVVPIVNQISFAAFSRIQDEGERVRRNVLRSVRLAGLLGFPAFLGLAAVAPDFVPLVLGAKWQEAILPLQLLCLVVPIKLLRSLLPPALFGIGRPGVNLANVAISSVIMVPAILIGVNFGVLGLCLAWVFAYPLAFVITTARALRAIGIPNRDFLAAIATPVLGSLTMLLSVVGLRMLIGDQLPMTASLGVQIALGALVYAGVVLLHARDTIHDVRSLVQR